MKVYMKPLKMVALFELDGKPKPIRFQWENKTISVGKICSIDSERIAGNPMFLYKCQSFIDGEDKPFELKYEINTCKWFLWKM